MKWEEMHCVGVRGSRERVFVCGCDNVNGSLVCCCCCGWGDLVAASETTTVLVFVVLFGQRGVASGEWGGLGVEQKRRLKRYRRRRRGLGR